VRLHIAFIVLAGALVYGNGLSGPLLFDDETSILNNTTIRDLTPLSRPLSPPRDTPVAGRPLVNLTFAVNYAETLRATVTGAGGLRSAAPVFPAYGALAAVWVPAGTSQVAVEATAPSLPWPPVWILSGLALLAVAARLMRPPAGAV